VAGAVSDLAAMGLGTGDTEILVALGAPAETPDSYLEGLADGVIEAAAEFGAELAGGDMVASPVLFLSVTVIAHVDDECPVIGRSGARPGDVVAVTAPIGGAAAGLKLVRGLEVPALSDLARDLLVECQVRPQPQLAAAPVLARAGVTAMIDVSDGLAADLDHVATASGVGIRLEAGEIPIVPGVGEVAAALGADPLEFAVSGGEDYVLALTIPQERFEAADTDLIGATGFELLAVGSVFAEDGSRAATPRGHDHFRGPGAGSR
jgi:thiamine-monophosphate kinase